MSPPIRETLTSRILHGKRRTVAIVETKFDSVMEAEVILGKITMKVLFTTALLGK